MAAAHSTAPLPHLRQCILHNPQRSLLAFEYFLYYVQVHFLEIYQGNIMEFWSEFGEDMMSKLPSMTLDTFKYARALVRGARSAASGLRG